MIGQSSNTWKLPQQGIHCGGAAKQSRKPHRQVFQVRRWNRDADAPRASQTEMGRKLAFDFIDRWIMDQHVAARRQADQHSIGPQSPESPGKVPARRIPKNLPEAAPAK